MGLEHRFDNPPVREVTLTLMFEPLTGLQTLHFAPLRVEWQDQYPKLSELAPIVPWRNLSGTPVEIVGSGSNWPVPLCILTNAAGDRVLQLQNDRFVVAWRFNPKAGGYPGHDELQGELVDKFSQLAKVVNQVLGEAPVVGRVEVSYRNLIEGVNAEDLALGILTRWKVTKSPDPYNAEYVGLRIHRHGSTDPMVSLVIGVDPANGLAGPEESADIDLSSSLTIEAEADVRQKDEYVEKIARVHSVVLATFLDITTPEMNKAWGGR
jgi:uncharacterized protein (TIGR04255 family)